MLVRNWMAYDPFTVEPDTAMLDADRIMRENKIRGLPVVKGKKLVGIVTERDIKAASASSATSLSVHELIYLLAHLKVNEIMSKDPRYRGFMIAPIVPKLFETLTILAFVAPFRLLVSSQVLCQCIL